MPIYEFRCLKCNDVSEFLFMNSGDQEEMKCKHCGAADLEKVMSVSRYNKSDFQTRTMASATSRTCGTGSCSTLELPGLDD